LECENKAKTFCTKVFWKTFCPLLKINIIVLFINSGLTHLFL